MHLQSRVIVGPCFVQMNEEEEVGPLVMFVSDMLIEALERVSRQLKMIEEQFTNVGKHQFANNC